VISTLHPVHIIHMIHTILHLHPVLHLVLHPIQTQTQTMMNHALGVLNTGMDVMEFPVTVI